MREHARLLALAVAVLVGLGGVGRAAAGPHGAARLRRTTVVVGAVDVGARPGIASSARPPTPVGIRTTGAAPVHEATSSARFGGPDPEEAQQGEDVAPQGTPEAESGQREQPTPEEPGDQNLPGGGHADPDGQDVQHEFQGTE